MMLSDLNVFQPKTLADALNTLSERPDRTMLLAGGTDAIIQLKEGVLQTHELLDISRLSELRYIRREGSTIHIGALTTYSDMIESSLLSQFCRMLVDASKIIGAPQIQSRATIGGNLANASPAGDTIPPLCVLGTTVTIQNRRATRQVPIEQFFLGYRKIDLRSDELITEISFNTVEKPCDATFVKLGLREAHFISIASVAVWAQWSPDGAIISRIKVALGAVAPIVIRARKCEDFLRDRRPEQELMWQAGQIAASEASPITDIRASAEYRRAVIPSLLYKGMHTLVESRRMWEKA